MPKSLDTLQPGDGIEFADMTQLPAFEDILAERIDTTMTSKQRQAWAGRVSIKELLRPPTFNGRITGLELVVMDEPYERLFDARDRGWRFGNGRYGGVPMSRLTNDATIRTFRGFTFVATAKSTGRGAIGQIQAELWYGMVPTSAVSGTYELKDGQKKTYRNVTKAAGNNGGSSIRRFVTKPKIETKAFINLKETSRKIGFEVLAQNMRHPLIQPIRQ